MTYWRSESLHRHDIDALMYSSPLTLGAPHLAAIEGTAAGSSLRYGAQAGIASLAEYVERRHFMHRVPCAVMRPVEAFESDIPSLRECYRQTAPHMSLSDVGHSPIQAVWALNYRTLEPMLVPRNLVSLSDLPRSVDLRLHPQRDSSGTAAHTTAAAAIAAATLEFIERQSWMATWLGAGAVTRIAMPATPAVRDPLVPMHVRQRLECYWLRTGLPAYTVFAAYFGQRMAGSTAQAYFSCGLAASGDPQRSLEKAITEANHYQHFAAEKLAARAVAASSPHAGRMETNSLRFQTPRARDQIPFLARADATLDSPKFCQLPVLAASQIRHDLAAHWPPAFLYLSHDSSLLGEFFVARHFGPDFYLHSDPGIALNFDNAFARLLGIHQPRAELRTSTCLP